MTLSPLTTVTWPFLSYIFKGGGHNFGIVTRFTLQTHPGEAWVSFRVALADSH